MLFMLTNNYNLSIFEILSPVIVYFITVGFAFELYSYKTLKLTRFITDIQRFNFIYFLFKKLIKYIKLFFYKLFCRIISFFLNHLFQILKYIGLFKVLKKYVRFNVKKIFKLIFKKVIKYKVLGIRFGFRIFLVLRFVYFVILAFVKSLKMTYSLYTWLFVKYLIKRHWIKGDSTLFNIPHFVLHHFILQFLIDLVFSTIEMMSLVFIKRRLVRRYSNYFFSYLFLIHISLNFFCILKSINGEYVKNVLLFSEAVTIHTGDSPTDKNPNIPTLSVNYKIADEDLIDKNAKVS